MMPMLSNGSDGPSEVPTGSGGEPFEEEDLQRRSDFQSRAPRSGADFKAMAIERLRDAGGIVEGLSFEVDGFLVDAEVRGTNGRRFLVLARGTPEERRQSGLRRTDTIEKVGFRANQLARRQDLPILLITSDLPERSTKPGHYLAALTDDVFDVVSCRGDFRGFQRLCSHFSGLADSVPPEAPWRANVKGSQETLFNDTDEVLDRPVEPSSAPAVNDDEVQN